MKMELERPDGFELDAESELQPLTNAQRRRLRVLRFSIFAAVVAGLTYFAVVVSLKVLLIAAATVILLMALLIWAVCAADSIHQPRRFG